MAIKCPNCGNLNPDDYAYCDECGARLEPVAAGAASADAGAGAAPADAGAGAMPATGGGSNLAPTQTMPTAGAAMSGGEPGLGSGVVLDQGASGGEAGPGQIRCPHCGTMNMAGAAFCDECGMSLSGPTEGTVTAVPTMPPASMGGTADADAPLSHPVSAPDATHAGTEPYTESPPVVPATAGMGASGAGTVGGSMVDTAMPPPATEDTIATMPAPEAPTPTEMAPPPSTATVPPPINMQAPEAPPPMPGVEMPVTSATPAAQTCRNCGAPLAPGARFCPNCGTPAAPPEPPPPPPPTVCPNCGNPVPPGARFCENCGQRLDGAAAAPAATAAPASAPATPAAPAMPAAPAEPGGTGTGPIIAPAATAPSTGAPRLEFVGSGAVLPLPDKDEILVGREDPLSEPPIFPDVDLTPYGGEEGGVSRRHARIFRQGGQYYLEDLHSTNYTKLDGMKLAPRSPQILQSGARIDFGKVSLFFRT